MARLQKPPRLLPGGTIGIAAISGAVEPENLTAGIRYLQSRGYRVVEAPNVRRRHRDFAGTDRERADGYLALLRNPEVQTIIFARGGWGAARVVSLLDPEEIALYPKIQMGGSDLASLFGFLQNRARLVCFHGPMAAVDFARTPIDRETDESWERVLRGQRPPAHAFAAADVVRPGNGAGALVGGCLSVLVSLQGTPDAFSPDGNILFWEDTGEEIYRLDRMLTQLRGSGKLDGLAGVIIGRLEAITRRGERDESAVSELLGEHFGAAGYPVVRDFPAGHGRPNRTLALGTRVAIHTGEGFVEFEESGVL